jgi:hypothetical protein
VETLTEKEENQERLLKASREGDAAAVRALLESGDVDANGVDKVRLFSALRQTACRSLSGYGRNGSAACACGLTVGFIAHELSVRTDSTSSCVIRRSPAGRGVAREGRR